MLAALGREDSEDGEGVPHPGAVAIAELAATPEGEAWLREYAAPREILGDPRFSNWLEVVQD